MERAAEAIQSRASVAESQGLTASAFTRECRAYHVMFDGQYWNVETEDGVNLEAVRDQDMATRLAVHAARHDHADGYDAMVCVEQQDGGAVIAWEATGPNSEQSRIPIEG